MLDKEKVISGLQYTIEMFLFDPATGHSKDPDDLNDADKITYDACVGAITMLKEQNIKREGRWKSLPYKKARVCSVCEADEPYKFADNDADVYEYCPHCGAKMEWR